MKKFADSVGYKYSGREMVNESSGAIFEKALHGCSGFQGTKIEMSQVFTSMARWLGGGFKDLVLGDMIQFDKYASNRSEPSTGLASTLPKTNMSPEKGLFQ